LTNLVILLLLVCILNESFSKNLEHTNKETKKKHAKKGIDVSLMVMPK